jgi:deoxyribonuclease-4
MSTKNKVLHPYLGSHISIHKGILGACKQSVYYKCGTLQIFLSNPRDTAAKYHSKEEIQEIREYIYNNYLKLFIHAPYISNIAAKWTRYSYWIIQLIRDIKLADEIGATGYILHLGKQLQLDTLVASSNMYNAIMYICEQTKNCSIYIIIEMVAGQGTEMFYTIDTLANFYKLFSKEIKKRVKICIDTCHIYAAGYDISSVTGVYNFLTEFHTKIGLRHVVAVHLNDSVQPCNSRVDRHAIIGHGHIGLKNLRILYNFFNKLHIPCIMETPDTAVTKSIKKLVT